MSHDELFITGVFLVLVSTILIFLVLDLLPEDFLLGMLLLISIIPVIILLESTASSAAPPACLDGFIVETNGGTGEAYTCTSLHP